MNSAERSKTNQSPIPTVAIVLATLAFVALAIAMYSVMRNDGSLPFVVRYAFILVAGLYFGSYVLFSGYVFRDASRRGMPKVPWTIIVLVIPYGVGFLLFFLLRKPLLQPCIHCGRGIGIGQAFCSFCGGPQENAGKEIARRFS